MDGVIAAGRVDRLDAGEGSSAPRPALGLYYFLTYVAVLFNAFGLLRELNQVGPMTIVFGAAAFLVYCLLYLTPVILVGFVTRSLLRWGMAWRLTYYFLLVATASLMQVLLFADKFIFHLYGFHLNGFVWNLVFTRGGLDSLGGSESSSRSFTLIIVGLIAVQFLLLVIVLRIGRLREFYRTVVTKRVRRLSLAMILLIAVGEQIMFGVCSAKGYSPVLVASGVIPLYFPITFTKLSKSVGGGVDGDPVAATNEIDSLHLNYPLRPIERAPAKPLNIVWLVSESLRYDMLDPEIMPHTWEFAHKSIWCKQHYSGGNGTRMGIFSMFYGLYGYYWFPFVAERRGPVFFDVLFDMGYQTQIFTSAGFSYPEFDKTVFVRIPPTNMHERISAPMWRRDEQQVTDILDRFDHRDKAKPYFTFMFFESPHANYHFPPESAIRKDYIEDFNYATMDLKRDIGGMKSRYINACHYLDTQLDRILKHLQQTDNLDSSIVLITGDHGEEFMEKGRWGHNCAFSEEQTRVPFVLWIPGKAPQVIERMTSHLDLPATILPVLGVKNEASDYSLGFDMLGATPRPFTIIADWNGMTYVDSEFKAVIPLKAYGFTQQKVTTKDDAPVSDPARFFSARRDKLVGVMQELKRFKR